MVEDLYNLSDVLVFLGMMVPAVAGVVEGVFLCLKSYRIKAPRWAAIPLCLVVSAAFAIYGRHGEISRETGLLALLLAVSASGGYSWVKKGLEGLAAVSASQKGKGARRGAGR